MVEASQAFKQAVRDGKPQRAMLRFDDIVITNEDISITSGGIEFYERFNEETDLKMGVSPSSSLNAAIINKDGLLNDYKFGKFRASIGALIDESTYRPSGNVTAAWGEDSRVFTGHDDLPYLRENGTKCSVQPDFPVKSIIIEDDIVYCFGDDIEQYFAFSIGDDTWDGASRFTWNQLASYTWNNLPNEYVVLSASSGTWNAASRYTWGGASAYTWDAIGGGNNDFNAFMKDKIARAVANRRGVAKYGDFLTEYYPDGRVETYEYVKLGTFVAPRPAIVRKRIIDVESNDQMMALDEMWADDISIKYPITVRQLLERIADKAGFEVITKTFMGSGTIIQSKPDAFDDATLREIVSWIAEAACSFARFNRDGQLELVWFNPTGTKFDEHDYSEFTPISYEVQRVSKLRIRNSDSDEEVVVGSGDNTYLIQNNPFLREEDVFVDVGGKTRTLSIIPEKQVPIATLSAIGIMPLAASTSTQAATNPKSVIYERLNAFQEFHPSSASLFTDWSLQSGDVVSISSDGESFDVPIYSMSMRWNGSPKIDIESTGNETREPPSKYERQVFESGRSDYQATQRMSGLGGRASSLEQRMSWAEINIDENEAFIQLTAGRVDKAEGRISQAEIDIDGANADIKLWAKRTEDNESKISQAFVDIDGANAKITLNASRIDKAEGRISSAEIAIDGANAEIALKVNKNGVISAINVSSEEIKIQASKINLQGYVTASQLQAEMANFSLSFSDGIVTKNLSVSGSASVGTLYVGGGGGGGAQASWQNATVVTSVSLSKSTQTRSVQNAVGSTISITYLDSDTSLNTSTKTIYYLGR